MRIGRKRTEDGANVAQRQDPSPELAHTTIQAFFPPDHPQNPQNKISQTDPDLLRQSSTNLTNQDNQNNVTGPAEIFPAPTNQDNLTSPTEFFPIPTDHNTAYLTSPTDTTTTRQRETPTDGPSHNETSPTMPTETRPTSHLDSPPAPPLTSQCTTAPTDHNTTSPTDLSTTVLTNPIHSTDPCLTNPHDTKPTGHDGTSSLLTNPPDSLADQPNPHDPTSLVNAAPTILSESLPTILSGSLPTSPFLPVSESNLTNHALPSSTDQRKSDPHSSDSPTRNNTSDQPELHKTVDQPSRSASDETNHSEPDNPRNPSNTSGISNPKRPFVMPKIFSNMAPDHAVTAMIPVMNAETQLNPQIKPMPKHAKLEVSPNQEPRYAVRRTQPVDAYRSVAYRDVHNRGHILSGAEVLQADRVGVTIMDKDEQRLYRVIPWHHVDEITFHPEDRDFYRI